jgi:predicted anti-sigma-YlaC factor YlaD
MKRVDCEQICMAAMAREDGYVSAVSNEQIDAHLAECEDCRKELEGLRMVSAMLGSHQREQLTEDLWQTVSSRLVKTSPTRISTKGWYPFLALAMILIAHRLFDLIPDRDPGVSFKLLPVLFVVAVFTYLRENPFKINVALKLEGE